MYFINEDMAAIGEIDVVAEVATEDVLPSRPEGLQDHHSDARQGLPGGQGPVRRRGDQEHSLLDEKKPIREWIDWINWVRISIMSSCLNIDITCAFRN